MNPIVKLKECRVTLSTDMRDTIIKRIEKELKKRTNLSISGMRSSIKLGFLAYEESLENITIENFGSFAGVHMFIVCLPEKQTAVEVAIIMTK